MITLKELKYILDKFKDNSEPEIEIKFKNKAETYMIISYSDMISFQQCGYSLDECRPKDYKSFEELCNAVLIDDIVLVKDWHNVEYITVNSTFDITSTEDVEMMFNAISNLTLQ